MKLAVHNAAGKRVRQITVDDTVFGISPNGAVLHQAFVAQRANQRRGTASTKSRGEVQGSTRKIRRQKYTGSARQGSNRSPVRVGGGVAFGPRPRSYRQTLPKKMRRLAIRSALSGKVADGQLHVVDKLGFAKPRTKEVVRVLRNVGIERSALIVTGEPDRSVLTSARNLSKTKVLPAAYLNVVDMLTHRDLLLTEAAVRAVEGLWGSAAAKSAPVEEPKPRRRRARVAEKPAEEAEAQPEPKPRRRRAAATPKVAAAKDEAPAKPARRARRPKAEAKQETKPAARRRTRTKKDEG
ncbi:MAG: 50S ribosomal protein L4 [Chloroflexi bacterium]|nr:50S ribosomal protein L4 [Chloroflexota bacterium]